MLCAVLLPLLLTAVLQLALHVAAEGDDQSSGVVTVHPLLDFHQPDGKKTAATKLGEGLDEWEGFCSDLAHAYSWAHLRR